jgi:HK97 family phage major capsid protein
MMEAAHVFDTDTGNRMPFPTSDDTNNIGALLQENTPVLEKDVSFGSIALEAYTYTSRLVLLPLQLIQDSAFPIDVYLAGVLGIRLGRAINADLTTGDGASKPNGLVTAASVGTTCAAGQTTSISSDDLFELKHSVDPAYRRGAKWMFHDSTLKAVKKLKDGVGRPLWTAGLDLKAPDTIDGDAYVINQDMPEMSANAKSIAYGDFSKYFVRRVKGVTLIRLDERYAERLQVGFLAFQRVDGELMDAGTHPVTVLQNSAE